MTGNLLQLNRRRRVVKMKYNYVLGLDIGISSVGWGLLALDDDGHPYKIIDVGSRIFTPGEVEKTGDSRAKERREKRGIRRVTRRREFRLDRVRNLLYENGFLNGTVKSSIVSEKNEELTIIYNNMINDYYKKNHTNPYKLKVEGLDRPLTNEELSIILVHYAKKRGYKSNREEASDNESGKVLGAIKENTKIMKENNYRTVSEMYIKDSKFEKKIKNSPNDYKISVTNEMYLEEINRVLDSQISFGVIDEKFKQDYLEIYNSRRHYSDGPGYYYEYDEDGNRIKKRSKYGGNLIEKMTGTCDFDFNPRAPKFSPSSEIFVALTRLVNLKYKTDEGSYISLNSNEIKQAVEQAKCKKSGLTYNDIVKVIGKDNIKFKGLVLSKSEYSKVIEEFKKVLNISKDVKVDISKLDDNEKEIFDRIYTKKLFGKSFIELKGYHSLEDSIKKSYGKDIWQTVKDDMNFLDELALYCTNYKINEEILKKIENSDTFDDRFADINFVKSLPNFKDHLMLSTEIIRDLIPLMLEGITYDKAMAKLNLIHSNPNSKGEKSDLLAPIVKNSEITNQRVLRSLTQARKVINAVIKKYGMPKRINIETARELAKSRRERNEIEKDNLEKRMNNLKIKEELMDKCDTIFKDINKISSNDILKYKLWQEQNEFCGYSMKKITIEQLFLNNDTQIDHILPYSRTFNDNYLNKTLVLTKENQEKGNKTPFEWFGNTEKWTQYESFINSLSISPKKKDNYLIKELDKDTEREMRDQNLNDTKYISRELASFIKAYLNVDEVNMFPGAITSKLRARWGFNRLTHSYISEDFYMPNDMKQDITKDRDNHLHHAMDALVIASITKSLENRITKYEKFSRYIDGLTNDKLNEIKNGQISDVVEEFYDAENGDIQVENLRNYIIEQERDNNIFYKKHNIGKLQFPTPYKEFEKEAKARVYEQNLDSLINIITNDIRTYTEEELKNLHTLTPSIAKNKISGKMHEETYYGIKEIGYADNKRVFKTLRTPIDKVKRSDLENIPDRFSGSKDIYDTLVNWFEEQRFMFVNKDFNKVTGDEILKVNGNKYPISANDKEHKEIKKVKLYTEFNNMGHIVNNSNVEKGGIYRIEVFRSNNKEDEKLYFAAYDIFEIAKIKEIEKKGITNEDLTIKLCYGRGKNYKMLTYQELKDNFTSYVVLNKNDLVKIKTKDDKESVAYIVGCSSGMLEVKSKIGDGYDLIKNKYSQDSIFNSIPASQRYQITVSTIKSIEKLSINVLGEISGI